MDQYLKGEIIQFTIGSGKLINFVPGRYGQANKNMDSFSVQGKRKYLYS
jgi:hypothetical protein